MSSLNKPGAILLLLLGVGCISFAHSAQGVHMVQASDAPGEKGVVDLVRGTSSAPHLESAYAMKRPTGNRLRCWQHGRLIYETRDALQAAGGKVPGLDAQESGMQNVQVMDMNHGLCIFESAPGRGKPKASG